MKSKTDWYWKNPRTDQSVIISAHTIVCTCLEVSVLNNVADIPRIRFNKKQAHQSVKRQKVFIYDA